MKTQNAGLQDFRQKAHLPLWKKGKRAAHDFYPTPPEAIRALLSEVSFSGTIWEPACGDGAISKVLQGAGYETVDTDLIDRGYGIGGVNFLHQKRPLAKNIVTNPPYGLGLGDRFVLKALNFCKATGGKVAMLMNLSSLCYPKRTQFFFDFPPKLILGLDELVCFPYGDPALSSTPVAKQRYCWGVWEPGYNGRPEFWWAQTANFKQG